MLNNIKKLLLMKACGIKNIPKFGFYKKPPVESPPDIKAEESNGSVTNTSLIGKRKHSEMEQTSSP